MCSLFVLSFYSQHYYGGALTLPGTHKKMRRRRRNAEHDRYKKATYTHHSGRGEGGQFI